MRSEMEKQNLYPPIFFSYPLYEDSIKVALFNEEQPTEWEKVKKYLEKNKYIDNKVARDISGIVHVHKMSRLLKKWTDKGLIIKIEAESKNPRDTKYKLSNIDEMNNN